MTSTEAASNYIQRVQREYNSGIAKEGSYRPALKALLESVNKDILAVNEPERIIKESAPDFIIQRERAPIAFVEAKDVGADLEKIEKDEQLQRYFKDFRNLILTDYLEFRWYYDGEHRQTVQIGKLERKKIQPIDSNLAELSGLLSDFVSRGIPEVKKARQLAEIMAGMTKRIKDLIVISLPDSPGLKEQKAAFEQTLLPHLSDSDFADMYAQTLAYGLFAARVNYKGKIGTFARRGVDEDIPATNPFLQKLFKTVMGDLDERVSWMVDTLIALLAATDTEDILKDFGKGTQQNDPILHFYETFLAAYDPALRDKRGVYYTPEPVVSYIVRSVDYALREHFKLRDGLADKKALILDPATGTGTFLYSAVQHIHDLFKGQPGAWNDYVRKDLLPRIFGFELLMASYTVAHMKLGILLRETGYTFESNDRLGVYLTNTLEENVKQTPLPMARFITEEANAATQVKKEEPIRVVMGNPPYSGHSANKSKDSAGKLTWIGERIRDYYEVDGNPLGERNPKWLQDDYVKFIRFGQWRISGDTKDTEQKHGVLAFVTNHGYLDNPTFRGMRQQLLQAFDDIYILNLHGNSKKKEKTPDGGKDENVFDIQQGVAIGIFIKLPPPNSSDSITTPQNARLHYADLWGVRAEKYRALLDGNLGNTEWETLTPQAPFYLFVPQNIDLKNEYEPGWKITEVMTENTVGVVTGQDTETIAYQLQDGEKLATKHHLPIKAVRPILYRPFDTRYIVYDGAVVTRPRLQVMRHLLSGENLALITSRLTKGETFKHAQVSKEIVEVICMSPKTSNNGFVFPLYLYPDPNDKQLFELEGEWPPGKDGRTPNLSKAFVNDFAGRLGLTFVPDGAGDLTATFGPEDVFHYAYAVFHSPTYRERYAEFLKLDFPRLPLTSDVELFRSLCGKGQALVDFHLLKDIGLRDLITTYSAGNSVVEKGYPRYDNGRVYINKTQYFEGIAEDVWEFQIGGYQVLDKWLKDRRGRTLSGEDGLHYQKIVVALTNTIRLMDDIDDLIPEWPLA